MKLMVLAFTAALPSALIAIAQDSPPTPGSLIARAIAVMKTQEERGWKYTYREDRIESQFDKNGQPQTPVTRTYEHIMLEGENYTKLVLIDGKPLDAKAQEKVDRDLANERANRQRRRLTIHREISLGDLDVLERLFDNRLTGEEPVLDRKAWRVESEPKAGYKPANKEEEQILAARHVNWFDEQDGARIRSIQTFVRAANGFQPGTTIECDYVRSGDAWLPGTLTFRVDLKVMSVVHARGQTTLRFYDYNRFTVDSTLLPQN
jgi:hypothetical protein